METKTYLEWYKSRMPRIHGGSSTISLLSSSVPEPWELIHELMASERDWFRECLHIPNPWGHPVLIDALAEKCGAEPAGIVLTQGATNAIFLICHTLLSPGDHVLVESPGYQPLALTPARLGARVGTFRRDPLTGAVDLESLFRSMTPATRLVILTNTHNPTGCRLSRDRLTEILETISEVNPGVRILVDEVYADFPDDPPPPAFRLDPRFITVSSLTKVYGLSFLRCGWICTDAALAAEIRKRQVLTDGIGSIYLESMSALVFAHRNRFYLLSRARVDANRRIVRETLSGLLDSGKLSGRIPSHGCICFLRVNGDGTSDELLDHLDRHHDVLLAPGRFFGAPRCFRIGFGGDPGPLAEGLERLRAALTTH